MATAILVGAGVLLLAFFIWTFNAFVRLRNRVEEAFSGVDVQLKRRHDLVPNLVKVVSAYAKHERETLEAVAAARTRAADADALDERERGEAVLALQLGRLLALVERYPELKADAGFRRLQQELVAIEDDLQYARRYYNGTVREYNTRTELFPANVVATLLGAQARPFFEVERTAERELPAVSLESSS